MGDTNLYYNLKNAFYDEQSQRYILSKCHDGFTYAEENYMDDYDQSMFFENSDPTDVDVLNPPDKSLEKTSTGSAGRKASKTLPEILSDLEPEEEKTPDYNDPKLHFEFIKSNFSWITCAQGDWTHLIRVWFIICMMLNSLELRERICKSTEQGIATRYFSDFDERFSEMFCGKVLHTKDKNAKRLIKPALTPIEIITKEMCLLERIIEDPDCFDGVV